MRGLARRAIVVDCYVAASSSEVLPELRSEPGIEVVTPPVSPWFDRSYDCAPTAALIANQAGRAVGQRWLFGELLRRHSDDPYDAYYQFSQMELVASRTQTSRLPSLVLHPQVHALAERRWLWRERTLVPGGRARIRAAAMATLLSARALQQQRSLDAAALVIAPSKVFADDLRLDHGLAPEKVRVIPNPVDLDRFFLGPGSQTGPLRLLFVAYLAVRKGLEMVVELSRRLRDMHGRVEIAVVGAPRLWSDYRPLLEGLDPLVARYEGAPEPDGLPRWFREADAILAPSHYEPFGLTVSEGLASGACVAVSDIVGAAEDLSRGCAWRFKAGDPDSFEAAVRAMLAVLARDRTSRRAFARSEAIRLFGEDPVVDRLVETLATVAPAR